MIMKKITISKLKTTKNAIYAAVVFKIDGESYYWCMWIPKSTIIESPHFDTLVINNSMFNKVVETLIKNHPNDKVKIILKENLEVVKFYDE